MSGRGDWRGGWDDEQRLYSGDMAQPLPAPNRQRSGGPRQPGNRQAPPPGYRQRPPQRGQGQPQRGQRNYDGGHQPPPGGRRGGPPPRPPGRPPRRKRRIGRIIGIFFAVLVLLLVGIWFYIDMSLNRTQALQDYPGRPAEGSGTNWLIVGTDSRDGLDAQQRKELSTGDATGKRTDTMMLLHIPDNDTKPTLVSLMRDSLVDIPGMGEQKLNAAYNSGDAALLAKTVELKTGMRINHYAEIGFGGFASVVDTVGGVNICVKDRMVDPKAGINLKPGCQVLDGPDALGYVRSRYATDRGDYDRVNHQREFLGALMGEVSSPGTILNPFKSIPLIFDAPGLITVDSGDHLHHLVGLAWAMSGAGDGSLVTTTVPISGSVTDSSGGDALAWDDDAAQQMFHALNNDRSVPKSILND